MKQCFWSCEQFCILGQFETCFPTSVIGITVASFNNSRLRTNKFDNQNFGPWQSFAFADYLSIKNPSVHRWVN